MSYFTYILYSATLDKFYIGSTSDLLDERLRRHNSNHSGFTGKANDWELVYKEEFPLKSAAQKREKEIKAWKSRKRIELLIRSVE
ncbi:MAG: GIY-YIG nuclease family protein [Bacteroidetes bacterium]|jgi:putative endonuclease|nr:MAG: GIY-YIG nuclease family protein [Bacteroidota bacterium]